MMVRDTKDCLFEKDRALPLLVIILIGNKDFRLLRRSTAVWGAQPDRTDVCGERRHCACCFFSGEP